jgi:hypothetical protein
MILQNKIFSFYAVLLITSAFATLICSFSFSMIDAQVHIIRISEKEESLSSSPIENKNSLNQLAIINQERNILKENVTTYDGLGFKLKYPHPWMILTKSDKSTCHNIDLCLIQIGINQTNLPQMWILQDNFKSQSIKEFCKCDTLDYFYTTKISQADDFTFINKTQTILPGDIRAIQIEYEFSPADANIHAVTLFTRNGDSFYQFIYYANPEFFSKNFSSFQNLIDTLEFA